MMWCRSRRPGKICVQPHCEKMDFTDTIARQVLQAAA